MKYDIYNSFQSGIKVSVKTKAKETLKLSNHLRSCLFDIVIDNMNLNPKELEYYNRVLDDWNNPKGIVPAVVRPKYDLEFKDFFIPLQDCIERLKET